MTPRNTQHLIMDDELRDQAIEFGLGNMSAGNAREYEAHLVDCAACRAEVEAARSIAKILALSSAPKTPAASLKDRLFDRMALQNAAHSSKASAQPAAQDVAASGQTWKGWPATALPESHFFSTGSDAVWQPTGFPGVEARPLYVDPAADRAMMVVRMQPGAAYPSHTHAGDEDCYVIQGDLKVGDVRMNAGDFKRSPVGSVDPIQSSENGCLLLIVSSLHDELHYTQSV